MSGLLIGGRTYEVPGLTIIAPGEASWAKLSPRDYRKRAAGQPVRQILVHSTKGKWPMPIVPGTDADAWTRIRGVADYWSGNDESGGAPIVVDGMYAVCLCDLALDMAYHATSSNPWSIGIEMYQRADGGVYQMTLHSTVVLCRFLADHFGIPFQCPDPVYRPNTVIRRLREGRGNICGVFGHRDQAWKEPSQLTPAQRVTHPDGYANRGQGDPGDEIYRQLAAAGAEVLDFHAGQDLIVWKQRQRRLTALGEKLVVDGIPGPMTMAAMRRHPEVLA